MAMQTAQVPPKQAFMTQLWNENPIFRQVLGICSALAVTNLMFNTLLMWGVTNSSGALGII